MGHSLSRSLPICTMFRHTYSYAIRAESLYAPYIFVGRARLLFIAKLLAVRELRSFRKANPQISLTISERKISRHSVG